MAHRVASDLDLAFRFPMLCSLHYTHSYKTSKIVAANMFLVSLPLLHLLSLKPGLQPSLKKLAR